MNTFKHAFLAGSVRVEDVDDWVEAWHLGFSGCGWTLQEFLGFTDEEYQVFATTPDRLAGVLRRVPPPRGV